MKKSHLSACPACARHVRVSETSCPFCGASLDDAFRAQPPRRKPIGRLGRAALYAFGASTLTLAGCSSSSDSTGSSDTGADSLILTDATYGGPPLDSSADTSTDTGVDSFPVVDAAYGGPPIDSGIDTAETGPTPAYGAPPIDGGHE